jgi:hypothetical protein
VRCARGILSAAGDVAKPAARKNRSDIACKGFYLHFEKPLLKDVVMSQADEQERPELTHDRNLARFIFDTEGHVSLDKQSLGSPFT